MKKIISILIILLLMTACSKTIYRCPNEDIVLTDKSLFCNGEFREVFTEIKAGELDNPNNYLNKKQWEDMKKTIVFDKEDKKVK